MNDCLFMSAAELAEAIRRKKFSATEVIQAHITQIKTVNPKINAVVDCYADRALTQAKHADDALAKGQLKGALHGVPFTIKDTFDSAGDKTTAGTLGLAQHVSQQDATIVKRLKAAGAILVGKTNMPELGMAADTDNLLYGKTLNPYDLSRTSGGSSGGEGAIIAAGGSAFGIGTDFGGSVRIPAHCCGITGLRPSTGRTPNSGGVLGLRQGITAPIPVNGPLARKVADLRLIMSIISGADGIDPLALPLPWLNHPTNFRHLKVAYFTEHNDMKSTADVQHAVKTAVQIAKDEGAQVTERCPPIDRGFELFFQLLAADGGNGCQQLLQKLGTKTFSPFMKQFLKLVAPYQCDLTILLQRYIEWDNYKIKFQQFFQHYDLIICPVLGTPAIARNTALFDAGNLLSFAFSACFSLANVAAVVIRASTSKEGLPIGVQIIAKPWREDLALNVAERLETQLGDWPRPTFKEAL